MIVLVQNVLFWLQNFPNSFVVFLFSYSIKLYNGRGGEKSFVYSDLAREKVSDDKLGKIWILINFSTAKCQLYSPLFCPNIYIYILKLKLHFPF